MKIYSASKYKLICKTLFLFLYLANTPLFAQQQGATVRDNFKLHAKGKFFFNWGYNVSWFEDSDIHFYGLGHDFTLYNVKAKDRPTKLSLDYIHPGKLTIPQFNFRLGYFIADQYSLSIGWDHMKYVAVDFQQVNMRGYIDPSKTSDQLVSTNMEYINSKYAPSGIYKDVQVQMTPSDFIDFEHTDGLNYASIDLERYDILWRHSKFNKLGVSLVTGAGTGLIVPRTDAHLFGSGRNHYWNLAGWGASAKIGLQINLAKHFFLKSDFKYGYLKLQNVRTTDHTSQDKAQQNIVFYENNWCFGFRF